MSNKLKKTLEKAKSDTKKRLEKMKNALLSLTASFVRITLKATTIFALIYLAARAPEIHGTFIRSHVGSKVYTMRGSYNSRGGGTGFAIEAPSGQSYIITNDHVCQASQDGLTMFVQLEDGTGIPRRILERSLYSDLCLVEGLPGVNGLSIGSEPSIGQGLAAVGHPKLMPLTLSRGELIGLDDILVPLGMVSDKMKCDQPKNVKIPLLAIIFGVPVGPNYDGPMVCVENIKDAYLTNIVIQPGSSGSPVVDFWGRVVAVVFAGDETGWGAMISHKDLTDFLSKY